ncbi:RNA methyltransferase [Marinoscillum furvescens]|uniref:SpoU rRNA methylase family protein n=1 Tax=Marinoscillum furvescens DSM 4134 TaxID=1122208 RepID=A0A3D9L4B0_MARFU|nr:RNA methyltransferase [Marinoscillum furvescens]REE00455.1 SpoU rRNA methylase family protein [Marinoscillum furvescens DSM 4134]
MRKLKNEELGRMDPEEFKDANKVNACIILDDIRSMNNIGSAFRTSDAFRIEKIHLCGITAKPPHRDINKTALGATDTVDWEYHEDILSLTEKLRSEGYEIVAVEQADQSVSLLDFQPQPIQKYAFVFGNEVFGVNDQVVSQADTVLEIPQYGTKHSLNISVSLGIVVWDYVSKVKCL